MISGQFLVRVVHLFSASCPARYRALNIAVFVGNGTVAAGLRRIIRALSCRCVRKTGRPRSATPGRPLRAFRQAVPHVADPVARSSAFLERTAIGCAEGTRCEADTHGKTARQRSLFSIPGDSFFMRRLPRKAHSLCCGRLPFPA